MRGDGRAIDAIRPVKITRGFTKFAGGSVLLEMGDTKVLCTATVEDKVPPFLKGTGSGWITAEYNMLPASTMTRKPREIAKLRKDGRGSEIQRLIGRALRSVVDLSALGERTIWVDCDVLQADGGTRCASITGAYVALMDAMDALEKNGVVFARYPVTAMVSAVSVGIVEGMPVLDLPYAEDSMAEVDMNVVQNHKGDFVEIQGTGEARPFTAEELSAMMDLARKGNETLTALLKKELGNALERVVL